MITGDTMEVLESPAELIAAARSYTSEALEVIAGIMRKSDSERMRLMAALALLDRAVVPRRLSGDAPPMETKAGMRERLAGHLNANFTESFDAQHLKTVLQLRSTPEAIRATLVQMHRDGAIARTPVGSFQGLRGK